MLVKLQPDQVARYWDFFKPAIEGSLPPIAGETPDRMNNILEAILVEALVVWLSCKNKDEITGDLTVDVTGFLVTQIVSDDMSKTKALLIYSIYTTDNFTLQEWKEGYLALSKFARAKECGRITAYSNHPAILKRADDMGADHSYHFISTPLI